MDQVQTLREGDAFSFEEDAVRFAERRGMRYADPRDRAAAINAMARSPKWRDRLRETYPRRTNPAASRTESVRFSEARNELEAAVIVLCREKA